MKRSCRGFTLMEVLVAMVFVAIVTPVVTQALIMSSRAAQVAEKKRIAGQLGETLLERLVLTDDWRYGERQGDFGDDWPDMQWRLDELAWEEDSMRLLRMQVTFTVRQVEHAVQISTVVEEYLI